MGSLFGGSSAQTSSNQSTTAGAPWQQANFQGLSNDAQGIYNSQAGSTYNGQLYSPINQQQQTAANAAYNAGGALNTATTNSGLLSQGTNAINQYGNYTNEASALADGQFNQGITGAGTTAANNVGSTVGTMNNALGSVSAMANTNPTQANIAAANQYANNPALQAEINANTQQISNTLNDSTLPSLNAQAIAGGNLNSSRAGAASAIATSQAQQNADAYAANVQSNAYNTGLQLAQGANEANMNANLGVANAANAGTYSGLMGENSVNSNAATNTGLQLEGTGLLGQAASGGAGLLNDYGALQSSATGMQSAAGGVYQNDANNQNAANLEQYEMNMQQPWTSLDNLQQIQGQTYGSSSTGTSTTQNNANPLGGILGTGALLGSALTSPLGALAPTSLGGMAYNSLFG